MDRVAWQEMPFTERSVEGHNGTTIDPTPLRFALAGYLTFSISTFLLICALAIVIWRRKDDQFQYRSPKLVIVTFSVATIAQLITGFSVSFNKPEYQAT